MLPLSPSSFFLGVQEPHRRADRDRVERQDGKGAAVQRGHVQPGRGVGAGAGLPRRHRQGRVLHGGPADAGLGRSR